MKGFTKAFNRASTSLLQATGAIEKTVDKDFDDEVRRYRSLESRLERLHKEAKGYLDALRAISLSQSKMAATIDTLYDPTKPLHVCAAMYKTCIENLEEVVRQDLDAAYRVTVLDPLSKFCGYFPVYNEAISKRSKKLLDYDAVRSKNRKLIERPNEDPTKLPRAEQEVQEMKTIFDHYHVSLKQELPKLIAMRITYLEPSFEALLKLQHIYATEASIRLKNLSASFQTAGGVTDFQIADRLLEGTVELTLEKMRTLPICVTPV